MVKTTRITTLSLVALALGFMLSDTARAAEFSVQIGALRKPDASFPAAAAEIGSIHKSTTRSGLTRYQVGRFSSRAKAEDAASALRAAGYATAYVVQKGVRVAAPVAKAATSLPDVASAPPKNDPPDLLASVPESLRSRVVLLDGRLHVHEGDSFIPLDQHPEANP